MSAIQAAKMWPWQRWWQQFADFDEAALPLGAGRHPLTLDEAWRMGRGGPHGLKKSAM
jgi:hypothetical protein